MNYRSRIIQYGVIGILFAAAWYWWERGALIGPLEDRFPVLVGTHGGYGYYVSIASVFLLIHLFLLGKQIQPFSELLVSRIGRMGAMKILFRELIKGSLLYGFVYVMVEVVLVCVHVDMEQLLQVNFFFIMLMYYIVLIILFTFGGLCFLLLDVVLHRSYMAMFITVAANMLMAYFGRSGLFYGGMVIIDQMTRGLEINWLAWGLNQMVNVCIIAILYVVAEEVYRRRDIV